MKKKMTKKRRNVITRRKKTEFAFRGFVSYMCVVVVRFSTFVLSFVLFSIAFLD